MWQNNHGSADGGQVAATERFIKSSTSSPEAVPCKRRCAELAGRDGGWYAELISAKGQEQRTGRNGGDGCSLSPRQDPGDYRRRRRVRRGRHVTFEGQRD